MCLDFFKNNSFGTYAIRVRDLPFCASFDGQPTYIFSNNFGNESSFNCSVSKTIMSVCIGNFQSKDAGIYSLHDGLTPSSNLLKSIRVVKASKPSLILDTVLYLYKCHKKAKITRNTESDHYHENVKDSI